MTFSHRIDDFLFYGCEINPERVGLPETLRTNPPTETYCADISALTTRATNLLHTILSEKIAALHAETQHIIPLSSGLDSRILLEALLKHVDTENITTVSYGSPGTWDFEIPKAIANEVGVTHRQIDLTSKQTEWSLSTLEAHAATLDIGQNIFESYPNSLPVHTVSTERSVIWSGFYGALTGGKLISDRPTCWSAAQQYFTDWNKSTDSPLLSGEYTPEASLPSEPWLPSDVLGYDLQLNLGVRQQCNTGPGVIHDPDLYEAPYTDDRWIQFWCRVPREYRQDRSLIESMFYNVCQHSHAYPSDGNYGAPISRNSYLAFACGASKVLYARAKAALFDGLHYPDPHENYVNYGAAFRCDERFRKIGREALSSLEERNLFEEAVTNRWKKHLRKGGLGKEIQLLISLELFLQVEDENRKSSAVRV
ncbi:asparagine synthase-related protein [Natronococcus sp. A-GB7]|uniref:asparagine synthase-related protein n=1 Tax=Natronococcus sp. A-GB7 TaxID=3037649 RepID=UPI00241CC19E|nr:asparagine synthase-related protein [Natronococcus sp. A-GB7]MDG5818690.1 asparagine synthase-related protein [Natronococcus sp. A-GB7]